MSKFAKFTEMVNGTAEDYVPIVEASRVSPDSILTVFASPPDVSPAIVVTEILLMSILPKVHR